MDLRESVSKNIIRYVYIYCLSFLICKFFNSNISSKNYANENDKFRLHYFPHFRSEKVYTFGKFSPEKMLISGCFSPEKMLIY